jgi:hypothetical protein
MTLPSSAKFLTTGRNNSMADFTRLSDTELVDRIAILRDNLRQLTEQAAAQSGAASEERLAGRIETQSNELDDLLQEQERRGKK